MRILMMSLVAMFVAPALTPGFAATGILIVRQQGPPVQILSSLHGIPDVLVSALFNNRSGKTITAYRIGQTSVIAGKPTLTTGLWMNIPAGIRPGVDAVVPAQGVSVDTRAESMVFFVSDVVFSDGSHWKAKHQDLFETKNPR